MDNKMLTEIMSETSNKRVMARNIMYSVLNEKCGISEGYEKSTNIRNGYAKLFVSYRNQIKSSNESIEDQFNVDALFEELIITKRVITKVNMTLAEMTQSLPDGSMDRLKKEPLFEKIRSIIVNGSSDNVITVCFLLSDIFSDWQFDAYLEKYKTDMNKKPKKIEKNTLYGIACKGGNEIYESGDVGNRKTGNRNKKDC